MRKKSQYPILWLLAISSKYHLERKETLNIKKMYINYFKSYCGLACFKTHCFRKFTKKFYDDYYDYSIFTLTFKRMITLRCV